MEMKPLTQELRNAADRCRQLGGSNERMAQGVEYALEIVEVYVGLLHLTRKKILEASQVPPTNALESEENQHSAGAAAGLNQALKMLDLRR